MTAVAAALTSHPVFLEDRLVDEIGAEGEIAEADAGGVLRLLAFSVSRFADALAATWGRGNH
jgi:hypothetical protein